MSELVQANWWVFILALLIGIAVAWWIFANRKTRVITTKADVLDHGAEPAKRNQALIDAPTSAQPAAPVQAPQPSMQEAVPAPAPAATPAPSLATDDLRQIKGVGPKLEALLHELGITSYAQIAGWSEADVDRIDAQLGTFAGRIRRDSWIEQAKFLERGDAAGFKARFGAL